MKKRFLEALKFLTYVLVLLAFLLVMACGGGSRTSHFLNINGDEYEDIVIGASFTNNGGTNRGSAFVYYGSGSGIDASPDELDDPDNEDRAYFGFSVARAGDVNGDGYDDIVIGAYGTDNGGINRGSAFVYYGSGSGIDASPDELDDPDNEDEAVFGLSVAAAGDVNGDGYDDIVIGAYGTDNGGINRGSAFVYYGSGSGINASPDELDDPDNENGAVFGLSVAGAGDVNGDGYDDIVIGAYGTDNGGTNRGSAFVYYGSGSGINASPDELDDPDNEDWAYFGANVAGAGDVNGDGYDDIVIGAYGTDNGGAERGSAFVYYGSGSGINASPDELDDPDNEDQAFFGLSVAGAGDVNGDGYDDIVIGACGTDNGGAERGSAFVYYGSGSGIDASPDELDDPDNEDEAYFGLSVAGAGDVNGDGYDDIVIGACCTDNGGTDRGSAFVYYGSGSGISTFATELDDPDNEDEAFFGSIDQGVD